MFSSASARIPFHILQAKRRTPNSSDRLRKWISAWQQGEEWVSRYRHQVGWAVRCGEIQEARAGHVQARSNVILGLRVRHSHSSWWHCAEFIKRILTCKETDKFQVALAQVLFCCPLGYILCVGYTVHDRWAYKLLTTQITHTCILPEANIVQTPVNVINTMCTILQPELVLSSWTS